MVFTKLKTQKNNCFSLPFYTTIQNHLFMGKKLTSEQINTIREEVLSGKTKYSVAKEMGISYQLVYYYTQDIPSSKPGRSEIRGKTLELLKQLLTQGYVDSARNCSQNLHTLRKHFPVIQRAQVNNKSFYFLDDKNKIALKAMLDMRKSKVISYHDLARMSQVFGVNLSPVEKNQLRGKREKRILPIIRRKDGGYMSSYKKSQTNLDDFMDNNGFLGNFVNKNARKNHFSDEDSTGETGGFLGRFLHSEVLQVKMIWSTNIALLSLPLCNQGETGHKQKDIR